MALLACRPLLSFVTEIWPSLWGLPSSTSITPREPVTSNDASPCHPTQSACLRGSTLTTLTTRAKVANR